MTWLFDPLVPGVYDACYIDPPWKFSSNSKAKPGRNVSRHYPVMTVAEVCALPVHDLAGPNGMHVAMWITGPHMAIGTHVKVFKAWRVKPSSILLVWTKLNPKAPPLFLDPKLDLSTGTGMTSLQNCEFLVYGRIGMPKRQGIIKQPLLSPRREHSRKPDEARERFRTYVGPAARMCEVFARESSDGTETFGNQRTLFDAR